MGSAGWNDSSIHFVCSIDFPVDILSVAQEKGRAGRRATANGEDDVYHCVASLESYLYLLRRIEFQNENTPGSSTASSVPDDDTRAFDRFISQKDFRIYQLERLSKVIQLLVLPVECQQCALERALANPFSNPAVAVLTPCVSLCQFCVDGSCIHPKFPRINKDGVRAALVDLFLGGNQLDEPSFESGGLINALRNYPDAQMLFFANASRALPSPINIKNLLLMLLAANIITHRVTERQVLNEDGSVSVKSILLARLHIKSDGTLAIYDISFWHRIPTL
jgi:hypothetical protein